MRAARRRGCGEADRGGRRQWEPRPRTSSWFDGSSRKGHRAVPASKGLISQCPKMPPAPRMACGPCHQPLAREAPPGLAGTRLRALVGPTGVRTMAGRPHTVPPGSRFLFLHAVSLSHGPAAPGVDAVDPPGLEAPAAGRRAGPPGAGAPARVTRPGRAVPL